jgi:hypothetical protein
MRGTGVPKASIDEHGHTGTAEDDVGSPPQMRKGPIVHAIPVAATVQLTTERQFWTGIAPWLGFHSATGIRRRRRGVWRAVHRSSAGDEGSGGITRRPARLA